MTDPSAKVNIQKNLPDLDDMLRGLFDHLHFKVNVSAKRVGNFDRPEIQIAGNRKVDIRI